MLEFVRAIQNTTAWTALAVFVVALLCWRRDHEAGALRSVLSSVLASRWLLILAAAGAAWNVTFNVYEGYAVPRDVMQDIVSAQEFLEGRSPYPHDMTQRIGEALEREPPRFSLVAWSPTLLAKEEQARRDAAASHWVQAHPPGMTMLMVPLVALLGVQGSYLALSVLSIGLLLVGLQMLRHGLNLELSGRQAAVLALLILGWFPVLGVLRNGQTGVMLGTLLIACWFSLKRGRPVWAGVAIGLATCIKVYPGVLLIYLLVRHRRAFAAAVVTLLVLLCVPLPFVGWTAYLDHAETARGVVEEYAAYPTNLGWLGFLVRLSGGSAGHIAVGRALWLALSAVVMGAACWLVRRGPVEGDDNEGLDVECSLFVVLTVALSPIAWHHYLPVLLLPLAVLGKQVLRDATSPGALLAYLGLLLLLAAPEPAFLGTFHLLEGRLSWYWRCLFVMPLPSIVLACTWLWLARIQAGRREVAMPATNPV